MAILVGGIGAVEGNFSGGASMRDRQADRRQIVGQKYFQTSTAGDDDDQLRRWEKYLAVTAVTFVES